MQKNSTCVSTSTTYIHVHTKISHLIGLGLLLHEIKISVGLCYHTSLVCLVIYVGHLLLLGLLHNHTVKLDLSDRCHLLRLYSVKNNTIMFTTYVAS